LENYAYLYAVTHGLKFVCLRPSNAFGIGQRPFAGQGFIPTAIASAMRGEPIRIFGQGKIVRDYIYVSDLAAGIVCALESGRLSEIYNLGSGVGRSNADVIDAISLLMKERGSKVSVQYLSERAFDVKANVLDSTKLQAHTSWQPEVEFVDGLRRTLEWLERGTGRD